MKKGLIFALTLMAVVALSVPAVAEAPVIDELPIVVIGENLGGQLDEGATTTKTVMRYLNALDLSAAGGRVDWKNETYTEDTYKVYWMQDFVNGENIELAVSGADSFAEGLTAAEYEDLTDSGSASFGTPPATGESVVSTTNGFWMSLLDVDSLSTMTGLTNAHFTSATIDTVGLNADERPATATVADLSATPCLLQMVAAVTSGTTEVMPSAPATLEVYPIADVDDQTTSSYLIQDDAVKWFKLPWAASDLTSVPREPGDGSTGFDVRATDDPGTKITYGTWQYSTDGLDAEYPLSATEADMTGKAYVARFRLANDTAATADLCPGFRFEYINVGGTHYGGLAVRTYDAVNAPTASADFTATLVWDVPFGALEMADGEYLSDWPGAEAGELTDWRGYSFYFDLFHNQAGDRGLLTLEEVTVEVIDKPTGGTTTDYTMSMLTGANIPIDGMQDGTLSKSATNATLQIPVFDGTSSYRHIAAAGPASGTPGDLAGNPAHVSDKIVEQSCTYTSLTPAATPQVVSTLHVYTTDYDFSAGETYEQNMYWFNIWGAATTFAKVPVVGSANLWGDAPGLENPGVPAAAGTQLSTWAYSHTSVSSTNDYFSPEWAALSVNAYTSTDGEANSWADDDGDVTISNTAVTVY